MSAGSNDAVIVSRTGPARWHSVRYGRLPGFTVRHRVFSSVLLRMHVCERQADFITWWGRGEWGFESDCAAGSLWYIRLPGPCTRGDVVVEAADAAFRSAVFFCLQHHRRDGQKDRDQAPEPGTPQTGGWSLRTLWKRRRSGAPGTHSTSSSPRRTTRGGWTFMQSPVFPSMCCVPAAPTIS